MEFPPLYDGLVADELVDHPRNVYPDLVGTVDEMVCE